MGFTSGGDREESEIGSPQPGCGDKIRLGIRLNGYCSGPTQTAILASIGKGEPSAKGRDFAAWLGRVRDNTTPVENQNSVASINGATVT
ncbi:hypothetical protein GCM10025772_10050 [Ferrimonas gelatinilytica]|uniref:Uncharacterized protein n=1 Tax=Ferrimonas gelatinilytica TaxID=1255257 RepID=A0ABP9RZS9_9GAMM